MITIAESVWNSFKRLDFEFNSRSCILICPDNAVNGNKWLYKTEYFGAFPQMEIEMPKTANSLQIITSKTESILKL